MEDRKVPVIRKSTNGRSENDNAGENSLSPEQKIEAVEQLRACLESCLRLIVLHPEEVNVSIFQGENTTVFKVDCTQRNIGRILGAKGKNIDSMRVFVQSVAWKNGYRAVIEVPFFPNGNRSD